MKATLKDRIIAESNDIVEAGGYHYFPLSVVRMEWLNKARRRRQITSARMAFSSTTW